MSDSARPSAIRPLTIALINNLYPPYIVGGNEILARDVTEALRSRGHTVHVLTGYGRDLPHDDYTHAALDIDLDRKEDHFLGGLPLTAGRVIGWHLYNRRSHRTVRQTLLRLQPDLIIAWNLYMASAAPLLAARGLRAPLVAHPADKWLLYSLDALGALIPANNRRQRWFLRAVERVVQPPLKRLAHPDYLLTVSEFIRRLHTERGYPPAQSRATWLGIHTGRFPHTVHDFPQGRPWRLVFAGQLWAGKGPQVAIEAVHLLRARADLPPVELDIFGGGTEHYQNYLRNLIRERGLEENVRVRGFTPQGELAHAFRTGDLFLFCSIWDEPFSGGLLEAMATGLPTIATTAGGTLEAVRHEQNSLVVPPDDPQALADAIARLMDDPPLFTRIGAQAAQEVAARWSFDAYIDRLERLYTAIVTGHRRGAPIDLGAVDLATGDLATGDLNTVDLAPDSLPSNDRDRA